MHDPRWICLICRHPHTRQRSGNRWRVCLHPGFLGIQRVTVNLHGSRYTGICVDFDFIFFHSSTSLAGMLSGVCISTGERYSPLWKFGRSSHVHIISCRAVFLNRILLIFIFRCRNLSLRNSRCSLHFIHLQNLCVFFNHICQKCCQCTPLIEHGHSVAHPPLAFPPDNKSQEHPSGFALRFGQQLRNPAEAVHPTAVSGRWFPVLYPPLLKV